MIWGLIALGASCTVALFFFRTFAMVSLLLVAALVETILSLTSFFTRPQDK
jgi:hypothetical protein